MEQIFYILTGQAGWLLGAGRRISDQSGDVVRIPPRTVHTVHCLGDAPLRYLAVDCFPAGCPQTEPSWDVHVQNVCRDLGWTINKLFRRRSNLRISPALSIC